MGMDVSSDMICQAHVYLQTTKGHGISPTRQLVKHDILIDPTTAEQIVTRQLERPNVVFIDIGGNRDRNSAIRVLQWCISTWSPRLVVVKNQELVTDMLQDL